MSLEEEIRQQLIEHIDRMVRYWADLPGDKSIEERCDGVAFSILAALDGVAAVPPFMLMAVTEDDGVVINEDCELHSEYAEYRRKHGK